MPQFHIVNESTEDTLASTDDLQDAMRWAREAARHGQDGELVSILESGGKAVRQFLRMPDGTVAEQAIAEPVKLSERETEPNGVEPGAAPVPARI